MLPRTITAMAACGLLATGAVAQGVTPWVPAENEPPPKLTVDQPLPGPLEHGAAVIQYHTENFRILPEVGGAAVGVSPRIGHLHVTFDSLPWHWADAGTSNTIVVADLPPGKHSLKIELADPTHRVITGQTVTFTVPGAAPHSH